MFMLPTFGKVLGRLRRLPSPAVTLPRQIRMPAARRSRKPSVAIVSLMAVFLMLGCAEEEDGLLGAAGTRRKKADPSPTMPASEASPTPTPTPRPSPSPSPSPSPTPTPTPVPLESPVIIASPGAPPTPDPVESPLFPEDDMPEEVL
ncbi:hypothetical protein D3C87_837630 [compost metagenome]